MKTAREIYKKSLAILGMTENENTEVYLQRAPHLINLLLAETADLEEALKGGASSPGQAILQISDMEEPLGLEDAILYSLIPLGLASLLIQEEEPERASFFMQLYQREKSALRARSLRGTRHKIRRSF